jgi:hypothetical protein
MSEMPLSEVEYEMLDVLVQDDETTRIILADLRNRTTPGTSRTPPSSSTSTDWTPSSRDWPIADWSIASSR